MLNIVLNSQVSEIFMPPELCHFSKGIIISDECNRTFALILYVQNLFHSNFLLECVIAEICVGYRSVTQIGPLGNIYTCVKDVSDISQRSGL